MSILANCYHCQGVIKNTDQYFKFKTVEGKEAFEHSLCVRGHRNRLLEEEQVRVLYIQKLEKKLRDANVAI